MKKLINQMYNEVKEESQRKIYNYTRYLYLKEKKMLNMTKLVKISKNDSFPHYKV